VSSSLLLDEIIDTEADYSQIVQRIKQMMPNFCVFLMRGDLAAGKTTFVRYFAESYGLVTSQSPTYSIHQCYSNDQVTIDHIDLYRLNSIEEVDSSGFWDLFQERDRVIFIEWSERIRHEDWPLDRSYLILDFSLKNSKRRLRVLRGLES